MIHFDHDELDGLVESLRKQPGFITAAVVPAGSGDALIDRLCTELGNLKIEVAGPPERPIRLGAKATELGQARDGHVFILRLDESELFDSEDRAIQFWRELNYQREALGSGTVRTCLLLSEESERGLALVADDLWDWTTIFRFPGAIRATVKTPADSEALVWSKQERVHALSETDLEILRSQWRRARQAQVPTATLVETYVVPLFLALPAEHDAEALRLWERHLSNREAVARLPRETRLLVARKMMYLAKVEESASHSEDLVQAALGAADGTVTVLERKATENPEAFEPGLAAALSTSAKLHQEAGRFEAALSQIDKCIDLLTRLAETKGGTEAIIQTHIQRREALLFLLRARDGRGRPLLGQIENLQASQDQSLDRKLRSNALGAALEISLHQLDVEARQANAPLFTAWLLSDDSRLEGPRFDEVFARDPASYCRALEAFWQLTSHTPWEKLLIEPLIRGWSSKGPARAAIRERLRGWLLHFQGVEATDDDEDRENEGRRRSWSRLQRIAIRVLGYRYEPDLLRLSCQYLGSLSELGEDRGYMRHRAARHVGFMLRWSYQEPALRPLQEIAGDPESSITELETAKDLANQLWQAELPAVLRRKTNSKPATREESFAEQLQRGQPGLLRRFSPEEFCERGPHWVGIAQLAADPQVPDLSPEDYRSLKAGLQTLIRAGRVRDDDGQLSRGDWIFDAWIPWLARSSHRDWWRVNIELIERQIELPKAQWALMQFPLLGPWSRSSAIATRIEELVFLATGPDGKELRGNHGLLELLRWALQLEDAEALQRCFEALLRDGDFSDIFTYKSIHWILEWALERPSFEAARERRRAASKGSERRLWFLVEWSFVDRLPPAEALAWCKEVSPLAAISRDLRWILVDQLTRVADLGALEMLVGDNGVADFHDPETQEKVLFRATRRQELDHLEKRYPDFIEGLTLTHRGTFLSEVERTEELRQWGHDLFSRILEMSSRSVQVDRDVVFTWNRRALHRWAHLEPKAFLEAAERLVASAATMKSTGLAGPALLEAILIVWQDLKPLAAAKARAKLDTGSWPWSQDEIPVHVHALWDPEFSARTEHHTLRLQWLRSCPFDKDIAQHAFAALINGMLSEVESIGKELLSLDRQLERALAVSLLAWHPEGDRWLEPLLEDDPSAWVRRHAQWAIAVCRRDRLGREIYRAALSAASWLEQQARFEQLVPLVLPTFSLWPAWDEKLPELTKALSPRRKALLIDFRHYIRQRIKWRRIVGRDLEKFCRGEDVSTHLVPGEKGPPWLQAVR